MLRGYRQFLKLKEEKGTEFWLGSWDASCIITLNHQMTSVFLFSVVLSQHSAMSRPTNLFPIPLRDSPFDFLCSSSFLCLCLDSPCSVPLSPFLFDQMPCCYAVSRQWDVSGPSNRHHCFPILYVWDKEEILYCLLPCEIWGKNAAVCSQGDHLLNLFDILGFL